MQLKPLVSIITITFNSEKYLEQTILSVINQTYDNIEYIIIDGGSEDKTLEIIKKYENKINLKIAKDNGISDAMNKGINVANGDLIGIIHSDDWYELNAVEKVVNNFSKGELFHGNVQYWKKNVKDFLYTANDKLLKKEMTINHISVFIKKEVYQKHGLFNVNFKYAMDYELMLKFYLKGASFFYLPETLANMRLEGESDKNWVKSYFETHLSKVGNGENIIKSYSYFLYMCTRSYISRKLSGSKLHFILRFVREKFALVKKNN